MSRCGHLAYATTGQYLTDLKGRYIRFAVIHASAHVGVYRHAGILDLYFTVLGFWYIDFDDVEVIGFWHAHWA